MSLTFNDTSTFKGIIQIIEKECGMDRGAISGNTSLLKDWAADVNLAWDDYLSIALQASGTWQFDDSNHTDYPIIKTNLVDGQRDYTFTSDANSNLILDIHKVAILPSATATLFEEIKPIDAQSDAAAYGLVSEVTTEGVPYQYDKTANGIFLDPIPSYNATLGLKLYINREASYFTSADTTKKPGCPGIHHRYFALKPAYDYARRSNRANADRLLREIVSMEQSIKEYFSRRSKDEPKRMTMGGIAFR